jgi:hypothetical protein
MMIKSLFGRVAVAKFFLCASTFMVGASQPSVQVASMDTVGPRPIEDQTRVSVIRDYLGAWQGLSSALEQNQPDLLNADFVGLAKQKLAETVREQTNLGIHVAYHDRSHDIKVVFYSPEGLSLQLLDDVEYDVEVRNHDGVVGTQHVRTRYVAVLTPTESKWKVRVFQGGAQ